MFLRDLLEEGKVAYGVLERSESHVTDMQAATSQVQKGEAMEEVAMDGGIERKPNPMENRERKVMMVKSRRRRRRRIRRKSG